MSCLLSYQSDRLLFPILGIAASAVLVLLWLLRYNDFDGKRDFAIAFVAMLWWLLAGSREVTVQAVECKALWASISWPGLALVPVAWCFFVSTYLRGGPWIGERLRDVVMIAVPLLAGALALTNPWHGLFYSPGSTLDPATGQVDYDHGPLFYLMVVVTYPFVFIALGTTLLAFKGAAPRIWPFLAMLVLVTLIPFIANAAYVFADFTVAGFDPTPLTFALALVVFSWLLANNRMMDKAALGRDVLYYTSSEPVLVADTNRRVVACNRAGRAVLFATPPAPGNEEGVLQAPVLAVLEGLSQTVSELKGGIVEIGNRIFEPRAVQVRGPIRRYDRILGWSISFIDITERERQAQALRKALAEAEAAIEAKDEFIAVASHELRTPMTSLRGGVDLLLSGVLGEFPETARQILELVRRNGDRLSELIEALLDLQAIENGALRHDPAPTDMRALMAEAVEEHRVIADAHGVRLELVPGPEQDVIHVDGLRLRQIVDNMLSNAVKFSEPGGRVRCYVDFAECGVRLSVEDEGIGIPAGAEEVVFGRFTQLDRGSTRKADGLGLGMNISRRLAQHMGGRLAYEPAPGGGTVFHLDLPAVPPQAA